MNRTYLNATDVRYEILHQAFLCGQMFLPFLTPPPYLYGQNLLFCMVLCRSVEKQRSNVQTARFDQSYHFVPFAHPAADDGSTKKVDFMSCHESFEPSCVCLSRKIETHTGLYPVCRSDCNCVPTHWPTSCVSIRMKLRAGICFVRTISQHADQGRQRGTLDSPQKRGIESSVATKRNKTKHQIPIFYLPGIL